jgi:D-galactonate transporter
MDDMTSAPQEAELDATYRKVAYRILPICLLAYVISFIDRSNIGMAKLQFMQDLGFSEAVYGLGAGLFFIGYMVFEIPTNLLIERRGARVTLAAIMIIWGAISSSLALVGTAGEFYALRFTLGLAEAGLFPGVILYLGYWFPKARRGRMMALFAMGGPIAGILGAPLSGWLMSALAGTAGLHGWQNLFIYEGVPAVLLGIFVFFNMEDRPGKVRWLTPRENHLVVSALEAEDRRGPQSHAGFGQALREPRVYVSLVAWIGVIAGVTIVTLWTPTFLSQRGGGDIKTIGLLSAIPSLTAAFAMYFVARNSDRLLERRWHFALSLMATALSLTCLLFTADSLWLSVLLLSIASSGVWASTPVFWAVPATYLRGDAAAAGIALISSAGGLGGFFGPTMIGWVAATTGSYSIGIATVAAVLVAVALLFLFGVPASPAPSLATLAAGRRTTPGTV